MSLNRETSLCINVGCLAILPDTDDSKRLLLEPLSFCLFLSEETSSTSNLLEKIGATFLPLSISVSCLISL